MIKHFCDLCDQEIKDSKAPTHKDGAQMLVYATSKKGIEMALVISVTPKRAGDICRDCIFDIVASFDPRPRPE